jgi:hypothetical protein
MHGWQIRSVIRHYHKPRNLKRISTLSRSGLDLRRRTLRTLLAGDATSSLSTSSLASILGLLCLPCALSRGLLLLALLDGSLASSSTCLWSLCAALLDHIEGCSDDGTLVLDRAAGAFLGNFLQSAMRVSKDVVSLVLQATQEWCVGIWYRDQG